MLSLIAEKLPPKSAGIVLALPSTIVVGYFFVALISGTEKIADIFAIVPPAIGSSIFFTMTYVFVARVRMPKALSVLCCVMLSLLVWGLFSVPLVLYEFSHLPFALLIYLVSVIVGYRVLTVRVLPASYQVLHYTIWQKLGRAAFAGSVIALATFLSKTAGAFWGGLFSLFPAAFLSTLVILHWNYDSNFLFRAAKNIPLGTISLVVYGGVAAWSFPMFGVWGGTLIALMVSGAVGWAMVRFAR